MDILKDKKGRVPFALLGIFLMIGSSITSTVIVNIENKMAGEVYESVGVQEISSMISFMQADLSMALNYAAMKAMDYVGKHPVTKPDANPVAKDYCGRDLKEGEGFADFNEMKRFNQNWTRNITRVYFNKYIIANYLYDAFNNGKYAINVMGNYKEDPKKGPIEKWRDIYLEEKKMYLDREHTKPLPAPPEKLRDILSASVGNVATYWKFYVPLQVEIKNLETKEIVGRKIIKISTLATSRMPLLMEMSHLYEESLKGKGAFILTTLLSEVYTEARALAQYGGLKKEVPNIVDDRWLKYLTNAVLLMEQFMVFNSIDPLTAIYLLLNIKDFAARGFPEENELKRLVKDTFMNAEKKMGNMFANMGENALLSISNDPDIINKSRENVSKPKPKEDINITRLAEDLLYEVTYTYYYVNKSKDKWEEKEMYEFKGYCFEENKRNWTYVAPPPYYYCNDEYGEIKKDKYEGKYVEKGGVKFVYRPQNEKEGYKRNVNEKNLSKKARKKLEEIINETYKSIFDIHQTRNKIRQYWKDENPIENSYWQEEISSGEWAFHNATPLSKKVVKNGDVIRTFPYSEKWKVTWYKTHTFVHKEKKPIINISGVIIGWKWEVTDQKDFVEVKEEEVNIKINSHHLNDVNGLFNITNIKLYLKNNGGEESHFRIDYNLYNISRDFVKYFVDDIRTPLLKNETYQKVVLYKNGTGAWYAMKWLYGIKGEVANALKEIFEKIKKDNINASITEDYEYSKKDYGDTIQNHVSQLKEKFKKKVKDYIDDERYRDGNRYVSCGARVIAKMRAWYVNTLWEMLNQSQKKLKESVSDNVTKALKEKKLNSNLMKDRDDAKKEAGAAGLDASSLPALQFGLSMPLKDNNFKIKEWVGFSINQEPDYFDYKESKEKGLYSFKVKNICLFGPTGLPILPTPITPWVITVNAWYIHVEGNYRKFEVTDTIGEMLPNILFGNSEVKFVKERIHIKDEDCSGRYIGWCEPIDFSISTVNVAIVPPGFMGDIDTYSYTKEIEGEGKGVNER